MKKITIGALAAASLLMLSACSSQGSNGGDPTSEPGAAVQGVTADTITIGTTLPLTGGASVAGQGMNAGLLCAVEEVNADGGLAGRQVKFEILDDGLEPARTVSNVRRLGDESQVYALVNPVGSSSLLGTWEYIEEKNLPVIGPILPPDPQLKQVYLLGTSHFDQGRVLVDYLKDEGFKNFGIIMQDNDLGKSISGGATEQAERVGLELIATEHVEPGATDVSSATLKMKNADPEAVIFAMDTNTMGLIINQADRIGWKAQWAGNSSSAATGGGGLWAVAGENANGTIGSLIVEAPNSTSDAVTHLNEVLADCNPDYIGDSFALQGYSTFQIFAEMVRQAGDDLSWDNFHTSADNISAYDGGFLPPVTFGALPDGRTGTTGAKVAILEDDEWTVITDDWLEPSN